VTLAAVV